MFRHFVRSIARLIATLTPGQPCLFPPGHFYSPIADLADIRARQGRIWAASKELGAIDWNEDAQLSLLASLALHVGLIRFPVHKPADSTVYYYENDQFPVLDAEVLFCLLAHFKPRRMMEVGSGFSSLVSAHVNRTLLDGRMHFTCIEPYPRRFLLDGVPGIDAVRQCKVEDVPAQDFSALSTGDVLFIDSSHVSKVGSDVNHLFFEVLPSLKSGVLIHLHDIFLPDEYPKQWILEEGRHWNEQYLLRAFLMFNSAFEIIWASHFMTKYHGEKVRTVFPRFPTLGGGGSLWLRKVY